ncbi:MAG: Lrp/AsnC family transcriptional regulator [Pseudomonadota bacterium]
MAYALDATDLRILRALMADGRITNVALAAKVGLSGPPCLRRMRALEQAGIITGYHAEADVAALGFTVTAFVGVALHNQTEADLRAFEERVLTWPQVREAYMMSGETDYHLKCLTRDLTSFQSFLVKSVSAAPNVAGVKAQVAMRRAKFEPGVPI